MRPSADSGSTSGTGLRGAMPVRCEGPSSSWQAAQRPSVGRDEPARRRAIPLEQPAVRRVARCAVGVRPVHVLPSGTTGRRNGERRREQRSPPPPLPHTGAVIIQAARRQSIAGVVPGDGLARRRDSAVAPRLARRGGVAPTLHRGEIPRCWVTGAVRLWSLHPEHLDPAGLVALWREGLLARNSCRVGHASVSREQLAFEWQHLLRKLAVRDPERLRRLRGKGPRAHPCFRVVEGPLARWEKSGRAVAVRRAPGITSTLRRRG